MRHNISVRPAALLLTGLLFVAGCGTRSAPAPADRERGKQALRTSLKAWQAGETSDSLRQRRPPIYMTDLNWRAGSRLIRFTIEEADDYHGAQLRAMALLTLQDKAGGETEKRVPYLIDTHPALVIVPGDP